jgi:hypothetical protein
MVRRGLHAVLEPEPLLAIRDVHVLDAERPAVRREHALDELVQRPTGGASKRPEVDCAVEILGAEAELGRLEQGMADRLWIQRVQMCDQVPELAVGVDEVVYAEHRLGHGGDALRGAGAVAGAVGGELEAREEQRPALVDRARVRTIAAILLFEIVRIGDRGEVDAAHRDSLFSELEPPWPWARCLAAVWVRR